MLFYKTTIKYPPTVIFLLQFNSRLYDNIELKIQNLILPLLMQIAVSSKGFLAAADDSGDVKV
jgi:hypothetical protein